jgi:hypothetical protein
VRDALVMKLRHAIRIMAALKALSLTAIPSVAFAAGLGSLFH